MVKCIKKDGKTVRMGRLTTLTNGCRTKEAGSRSEEKMIPFGYHKHFCDAGTIKCIYRECSDVKCQVSHQ